MRKTTLDELIDTHLHLQKGCYFEDVDVSLSGPRYAWAKSIPDTAWNIGLSVNVKDATHVEWALASALKKERTPAIFVRDAQEAEYLKDHPRFRSALPERWMLLKSPDKITSPSVPEGMTIEVGSDPVPPHGFLTVFGNMFPDEDTNIHFRSYYVPALGNARPQIGVRQFHFVLSERSKAASCASIYLHNDIACLYNVGTTSSEQRRGLGRLISQISVKKALEEGAKTIFLQCECDGSTEKLYASLGFAPSFTPFTVVFR